MKCHICNNWTPEGGCKHYLPDSLTVVELAGYEINTTKGKVVCKKDGKKYQFESFAKAADALIHNKKEAKSC